MGIIGDWIGRRWGLIQDAGIMLLGGLWLSCSWGASLEAWVITYSWALFLFGLGVGGAAPSIRHI